MATPNRTYVVTLAVVAALILVIGGAIRPRARRPEQPPPLETDLAKLGRLTERRALESRSAFLAELSDDIAPGLVWVQQPAVTGIAWTAALVATSRFEPPSRTLAVTTAGGDADARVGDWSPDSPVASVALPEAATVAPPMRADSPAPPGTPAVVVWQSAGGRVFAPASVIEESATTCDGHRGREVRVTLALARSMVGGGLFDLDGRLLGMILPCGGGLAAIVPEVVDEWLRANTTAASRLLARYGAVFEPLTAAESSFFGVTAGVMVRELRAGRAGALAGLRPGDVVAAVDGTPVTAPDEIDQRTRAASSPTVQLSIKRGPTSLVVDVARSGRPPTEPVVADVITADAAPTGVAIEALAPSSPLAAAGLRVGDRVVRVGDGARQTPDRVRRTLQATTGPPVFVEYERAGHRRGALVVRSVP